MKITRVSIHSGIERTIDLPITQKQIDLHHNGGLIQEVMHNLNASEREFYLTGMTDEEWNEISSEE